MDIFQQSGFVGSFSEVVEVVIKNGEQIHVFPNTSNELQKQKIIGLLVMLGDGTQRSVISQKVLATKAQISTAFLNLVNENRTAFKMPVSLFTTDNKPLLYIPVNIKSFNALQSSIIFPAVVNFDAVVQVVFIAGQ